MTRPDDSATGMSKREYFAGLAMAASAGSVAEVHKKLADDKKGNAVKLLAEFWVMMADSLIAELSK